MRELDRLLEERTRVNDRIVRLKGVRQTPRIKEIIANLYAEMDDLYAQYRAVGAETMRRQNESQSG